MSDPSPHPATASTESDLSCAPTGCETCTLACSMAGAVTGPGAEERVALAAGGLAVAVLGAAPLTVPWIRTWWLVVAVAATVLTGMLASGLGVDATRHGGTRASRSYLIGSRLLPLAVLGALLVWGVAAVRFVLSLW